VLTATAALLVEDHHPDLSVLGGVTEQGLLEERVGARLRVDSSMQLPKLPPWRKREKGRPDGALHIG
jgi:hypothetical protein